MTREEAIKILKFERGYFCDLKGCKELQAFTMAIKALEQEPCEDCISREAVLGCLTATKLKKFDFILHAREEIKKLPPVTPQPKIGRWMRVDKDKCKCDQCEVISFIGMYPNGDKNYCPNCGTKMQDVEE